MYGTITLNQRGDIFIANDASVANFVPYFGRDFCESRDLRWTVQRLESLGFTVVVNRFSEPEEPEPEAPHYHVNQFINGCLNDASDGPYETLEEARERLAEIVNDYGQWHHSLHGDRPRWTPAGTDRYVDGLYILKIEDCAEPLAVCRDSEV